ncbi:MULTISPECIES: hypothetical protein [unclassified Brevundimonas]|uniref:hypothetical protein n=1 Tax=unclassified Brevundimonas TaxID=2622653 RepID=UPI0025C1A160|nr:MULTISPECIES: hypothetical protein [unclassified Brevundimonas]
MTQVNDVDDLDGGGFDFDDWDRLKPFTGRVATLDDVHAKTAIFALGDTERPYPLDLELPQPAIWWDEDGEKPVVIIQAEAHTNSDDEEMEVYGLILPDGDGAVALSEDVDLVDASDATWRQLVQDYIDPSAADD